MGGDVQMLGPWEDMEEEREGGDLVFRRRYHELLIYMRVIMP